MLSGEKKIEFLKKTPLFFHMQEEELRAIGGITNESEYPAEHVLFKAGDLGESLYLLLSGEVALYKEDLLIFRLKGVGSCFGEMALVEEGGRRSATVVCLSNTTLLHISRIDFFRLMTKKFSVVEGMFRVLNAKIRENLDVRAGTIQKEATRIESMRLAKEIQQSLLPQKEVSGSYLNSSGYCKSADVIGGDYYDYLDLKDGRYAVILADVMGHGYHSALLMAMTKSGLHTQVEFDPSLRGVLGALSRVAWHQNKTWVYLTCCYVILDASNAKLEYINAGHPPMLHYSSSDREIFHLDSQSQPLGFGQMNDPMTFEFAETSWKSEDVLLLYSDGIIEATSPKGTVFGITRLQDALYETSTWEPLEIREHILAELKEHLDGGRVEDDWTLVVLKFSSGKRVTTSSV